MPPAAPSFSFLLSWKAHHGPAFQQTSSTLAVSVTNLCITCILLTQFPRFLFSFLLFVCHDDNERNVEIKFYFGNFIFRVRRKTK